MVLPHGGPAARDDPGFDWWAQALASRGYAVAATDTGHSGNGLRNLRERAARLGGTLAVDSTPGQGTRVRVSLRL